MSNIIDCLAQFVKENIVAAIESSPDDALRVVFSAPPKAEISALFEALTKDQGCLVVETGKGTLDIPVYLIDPEAEDPHKSSTAARCTPNYLVTIRNFKFPVWLALQEVGATTNASLSTAVNPLGISKEISHFQSWLETPIITYILERYRASLGDREWGKGFDEALDFALAKAWDVDERYKDKRTAWRKLALLLDDTVDSSKPYESFLAKLGLPNCTKGEVGSSAHLKVLERVADMFRSLGLRSGFDELESNASEEILPYVQAMRSHIENQGVMEANDFSKNALQIYSPITSGETVSPPDWWCRLDLAVWNDLLDASQDTVKPTKGELTAKLTNSLVGVPKGVWALVTAAVELEISNSGDSPIDYIVERANGGATLQEISSGSVEKSSPVEIFDNDIPVHERFMRYKISAEGHVPIVLKIIVLDAYGPGVVAFSAGSEKATPFKLNKKARDHNNKKVARYESDLNLPGMGSHNLDLYVTKGCELDDIIYGYDVDAEQEGRLECSLRKINDNHYSSLIETDEECYYEISARSPSMEAAAPFRIYITAEESKQQGARSEFDRLVMLNLASANGNHASPRVDPMICRLMELESWILESSDSFFPLVLGPDYRECWGKPEWDQLPTFSNHRMALDPRPKEQAFEVPSGFVTAREKVLSQLRAPQDEQSPNACTLKLYELMQQENFVTSVQELLSAYFEWLQADYDTAAWSDIVCVHSSQSTSSVLESMPYAVMLSPFHPIKLAWQCCAQSVLQDALDKHARCPAASVMNPTSFPDCFILPCRTATGSVEQRAFAAMASSSDYWGVLLAVDAIDSHHVVAGDSVFDEDLGVCIDGLSSGFSAQQVVRSLDEVSRLMSAKSTLRVGISSDEGGSATCNDGVDSWCSAHLGGDEDEWQEAGPKSVIINDRRGPSLHPEQAMLASLTARTDAAVRWFTGESAQGQQPNDLSIIAHLSTMSPSFERQQLRSAIDGSVLSRWRIRKQVPGQDTAFIAESRIGEAPSNFDRDTIQGGLLRCVDELERQCRDKFDSYIFAPDMANLNDVVNHSRYTAISSTDIDAACFFGSTEKAYLWDYELPSYSRRAGENSGYYLLAKESPGMLQAVRSAVGLLGDGARLEDSSISVILDEISRRGMPTLKRLTGGGTMSFGEIGMLVALRILQSEFEVEPSVEGLIPVFGDDETLNLVISADPFQKHFDNLRSAIGHKNAERPDLLVLSIQLVSGKPVQMHITPVEVKARGSAMSAGDKSAALGQASNFADFLIAILEQSLEVELWGIAWRNLLATMLDYGFRVYGQLETFMNHADWAGQHSAVLQAIASSDIEVSIDKRGRLVVIDASGNASQQDLDRDGFTETICLNHKEALCVLTRDDNGFTTQVNQSLGYWELKPTVREEGDFEEEVGIDIGKPTEADSPNESPEADPAVIDEVENEKTEEPEEPVITGEPSGIEFLVGKTVNQFTPEKLSFFPGNTALNQLNVGIVGDLGTGKTQLIQALVHQLSATPDMNRGKRPNILIFDYKRDYSKPAFVEATGARVVKPIDIPLNLFDTRDSNQGRRAWLERSKFFIDVLDKIYSGIGAVQRTHIKNAVKKAYEWAKSTEKSAPTINDVFEAYKAEDRAPDTPYTIMDDLVDGEYFVANSDDVIPFSEFLDGVVVIDLSEIGQDDRTKNMLVVIFLNLFYEHMLRIEKKPFLGNDPQLRFIDTMLLVDEADNIMKYEFDVLKKILLQGREFGVGVLLASQYLSHFKTSHENYLEPLLSWFVHKVPNVTVKELEGIGLTGVNSDVVDTIKALECHECLYKTLGVDGKVMRATPFFELMRDKESSD